MKVQLGCLLGILFFTSQMCCQLRLPALISDGAMFQADKPVAIWGWANAGSRVTVIFHPSRSGHNVNFIVTADSHGKWFGKLPPFKSGAAGQLSVSADKGQQKVVSDILFGEVWLGSGQSNMEYDVAGTNRTDKTNPEEVAQVSQNVAIAQREADSPHPPIRYFKVEVRRASEPQDDVTGKWVLASSENVSRFSAVAWNFGVALQHTLHGPVGLIVSCVGNTPVETWMSRPTLELTSVGATVEERNRSELLASRPENVARYETRLEAWRNANPTPELQTQNESTKPAAPNLSASNYVPNQYYNGMISGIEPYTVRGIIWYQGVGNFGHPLEYSELFTSLIREWREEWKDPRLPFYFVEESNFQAKQTHPVEANPFSIIREQQHAALSLPAVGIVCSADLGNGNPHYPNKKPVGERLAHLALHDVYGRHGQVNSPTYSGYLLEGSKIRLKFKDADGLRVRGEGALQGFAVRDLNGSWVWATGRLEGKDIVVWSDQVRAPVAVRYGWAVNPMMSVENGAGLPLCPFRSDTASKE